MNLPLSTKECELTSPPCASMELKSSETVSVAREDGTVRDVIAHNKPPSKPTTEPREGHHRRDSSATSNALCALPPLGSDKEIANATERSEKKIAHLADKFAGVTIDKNRHDGDVSIRALDQNHDEALTTARTNVSLNVTKNQARMIAISGLHRRIMQTVPVRILVPNIKKNSSTISILGTQDDVRHAAALILEHVGEDYEAGYYLKESSLFTLIADAWRRDPTQTTCCEKTSGAKIRLEETQSAIIFSGKRAAVRKAKVAFLRFLKGSFSSLFVRYDLPGPFLTCLERSGSVAEVASASGAQVVLDRDIHTILLFSSQSSRVKKAREILGTRVHNEKKLVHVLQLEASEDWLVSLLLGKNGSRIKSLRKQTKCNIEVQSRKRRVTISAKTQELVAKGKRVIDEIVTKARKENAPIELRNDDLNSFFNNNGNHKLEGVKVQIVKRGQSSSFVRLVGKEEAVVAARDALRQWLDARSEKGHEDQGLDATHKDRVS